MIGNSDDAVSPGLADLPDTAIRQAPPGPWDWLDLGSIPYRIVKHVASADQEALARLLLAELPGKVSTRLASPIGLPPQSNRPAINHIEACSR